MFQQQGAVMNLLSRSVPAVLLLILMAAPACSLRGPEGIRRDIARSTGYEYSREMGMTIGRIGLAVARNVLDEEEELRLLEGLTKIQVGIYQVESRPREPGDLKLGRSYMANWEPMANVREDDEDVMVLLKRKKGQVREMLVVVSDRDELTIVRMKGRLDDVLEEAVAFGRDEARQDEGRI